ncbi:MAG: 5-oxoprolinase subunit PxpA [Arachnia propionica]|uniref:LamB/YcsF family protein n=1 Tax=Arachnia propionica TaxID=1750 RepID=UPI00270B2A58|nr:5-oxoprolinase subunit PxpA [Arachnia propionica]
MRIDLNADVGESFGRWRLGDDAALLAQITSANVACGFHAGDPMTLTATCGTAQEYGVVIGAQVSYRDLAGFGRRFIDASYDELRADVIYQIGALQGISRAVAYVKPHGALYHATIGNQTHARAVVDAASWFGLPVLGLPGSLLLTLAEQQGVRAVKEGFADRGYLPDGTLVPRDQPGALITDAATVAERVVRLATTGELVAVDGTLLRPEVDSVCLHGDTPGAAELAGRVRDALSEAGVEVASFA